jgi:hypothetical protein
MQHPDTWMPSKFVLSPRGWTGSPDHAEVLASSRLMASLIAEAYCGAVEEHARGRLVDLGCGKVPLYGAYRNLVDDVTCVDWPNTPHPSPHLDAEIDLNSEPWDLPEGAFDTVILTDVLEHLARPELAWRELARITARMGRVIVGVPFAYQLHETPHDHFRYTEYRLRLFCEDHGFRVLKVEPYGGVVQVLADITAKLLAQRWATRWAVGPVQSAGLRLGGRDDRSMPLGYLLVASRE